MKRYISAIITLAVLSASVPLSVYAAFDHSGYWPLLEAYTAAMATEAEEDDVKACTAIIDFYKGMTDVTSCQRLVSPCTRLGRIYEKAGSFADAKKVYELLWDAYTYVYETEGDDYGLMYLGCVLDQFAYIKPTVYAKTKEPENIPYYGAPGEPQSGVFAGMCDAYDPTLSTGALIYVEFSGENFWKYDFRVPDKKERCSVEFAWNIPNSGLNIEMLTAIAAGDYDEYIIENLTWLNGAIPESVFIRFAAEVNCWGIISTYAADGRLEEFVSQYIAAFRHISEMRDVYAPKAAMVYSVTEVSNIYVDHTTFYPGDDAVDFVGVSAYTNRSSKAENEWGSFTDAFNGIGKYANSITRLRRIVDDFGDRKPILITECGFCYESTKSEQDMAHASDNLRYFYTYVNMVFPEVKGVFYFNTNFGGNSYKLFSGNLKDVNEISAVYREMMDSNVGFSSLREGSFGGYTEVRSISEITDTLSLSLFAVYPGNAPVNVSYEWDGETVAETSAIPYSAEIVKDRLTEGEHTLSVSSSCGTENYRFVYRVTVDADGTVTVGVIPGDTDLNGKVNLFDASAALKHIARWDVELDLDGADINGDGRINLSDVSMMLKTIAGWDI
ncbi:MAG: hypothetical protein E7578_06300 [Ruminococcaceae bacterium]|nr:hypothetical protein [Oscillospiraceae bacterium]